MLDIFEGKKRVPCLLISLGNLLMACALVVAGCVLHITEEFQAWLSFVIVGGILLPISAVGVYGIAQVRSPRPTNLQRIHLTVYLYSFALFLISIGAPLYIVLAHLGSETQEITGCVFVAVFVFILEVRHPSAAANPQCTSARLVYRYSAELLNTVFAPTT